MSIKAFLTSALFKSDQAGRTIVYPNGVAGRGYFVPDAATELRMRRTLMWAVLGSAVFGGRRNGRVNGRLWANFRLVRRAVAYRRHRFDHLQFRLPKLGEAPHAWDDPGDRANAASRRLEATG